MKRIKIMLTSVAVLAVVGGGLAFKAVKSSQVMYRSINNTCPSITQYQPTEFDTNVTLSLYTTNNGQPLQQCPGVSTTGYFTQQDQ